MTLAALISAYHESDEPGAALRATLPLAGRTLFERQSRLAAGAGADPIVVAVERVPAELAEAIDRLRAEGIRIAIARNAAEAADAVHPGDRLLLIADGLIASESHIDRLLGVEGHAILTLPDIKVDDRYERIDARNRWAGLAVIDGDLLKRTAAMLQDWDLQSTLLRRAVQGGARQIPVRGEAADDALIVAERRQDLADLQARIFAQSGDNRKDWVSRFLLAFPEREAVRWLMSSDVTPALLNLAAAALTALALFAFAWSWLGAGLALMLVTTPIEGMSERLTALRMQDGERRSWWAHALPLLEAAAFTALTASLAATRGWGCIVLAVTAIAFLAATRVETRGRDIKGRLWLAERKGMTWLILPFALAGVWTAGLAALAAYAAGSFFWAQSEVHQRPRA